MSPRKVNFVSDPAKVTHVYLDEIQEIRKSRRDCFTPILSDEIDDLMLQLSRVIETLEEEFLGHG